MISLGGHRRAPAWLAVVGLMGAVQLGATRVPPGRGMLLPVQDRVGEPETAALVGETLFAGLQVGHQIRRDGSLRQVLRRLRIRDVNQASPEQLESLGRQVGADWFVSVTLLEAVSDPVPQVALSARLVLVDSADLAWVDFEAATGRDSVSWLGRGGVPRLEDLAREVAERLVESLRESGEAGTQRPQLRLGRDPHPFLAAAGARSVRPGAGSRLAVVPFDGITQVRPTLAAEIATQAMLAALYEDGFHLVAPGWVLEVLRQQGAWSLGVVDRPTREALRRQSGAVAVLTGTVEEYRPGVGFEPDPKVELSARLVDGESGRIVWMSGQERRGRDTEKLFHSGRIFSSGVLIHEIMRSMVAGLQRNRRTQPVGELRP